MTSLDKFLVGNINSYEYGKYGNSLYGLAKLLYRERFVLVYSSDLCGSIDYQSKAEFEGFYDSKTKMIYVDNEYYNELYNNSDFDKVKLRDVQTEMCNYVNAMYNNYIKAKAQDLKAKAYPKFKEFYDIKENMITLQEQAEQSYYSNRDIAGYFPTFGIDVPTTLDYICDYIINKDEFANKLITEKLQKDDLRKCSNYSGIMDIKVNQEELIGIKLLEQDKIAEICNDIDNDKNPNSKVLKKYKALKEVCDDNCEAKTFNIGFDYKGNQLEVSYPRDNLYRLYISEYDIPVAKRTSFKEIFSDLEWGRDYIKIMSIKYIKYRGKIIYEDENI